MLLTRIKSLASTCGFELAGAAPASPAPDFKRYRGWVAEGMAGAMDYLADRRADLRGSAAELLPSARTIICVAKLYNVPDSPPVRTPGRAWVARYALGSVDYHDVLRRGLEKLAGKLRDEAGPFDYKACVDTAPLLERSYANQAGLGWIGKNSCLIHQPTGSWYFLAELITSLDVEYDEPVFPAPDRCGTCTRCIDACPTNAFVPDGTGRFHLDARRCISYFTIELKGSIPEGFRSGMGNHVFGCDICQDVCPWNRKAPTTNDPAFVPVNYAPPLEELAALTPDEFRTRFRGTPVIRTKYSGFMRNVAIAMGNSGDDKFRPALERLAASEDAVVREHADWALRGLDGKRRE